MNLIVYSSEEWALVSEDMHFDVFCEHRPRELNRIDFAVAVWNEAKPIGYVTCTEYDSKSVYMGYGGALKEQQGKHSSIRAYKMILEDLAHNYARANTLIENTNTAMLKLAMSCGFIITGMRVFNGSILLEHSIEWSK